MAGGKRGDALHNDPPDSAVIYSNQEKAALRAEFARRLQRALTLKGWRQSTLAEEAQKVATNGVRVGRDLISHYIAGRYLPAPPVLRAIATALDTKPTDLLPARVPEVGDDLAPLRVQDMNNGLAWIKVNQSVPWPVALKIMALLRPDGEDEPLPISTPANSPRAARAR